MEEFKQYEEYEDAIDQNEDEPHFFCKLTFGQFFTLMVLEIITLCFVFYLGARYGNEYLKLDIISEKSNTPVSVVSNTPRVTKSSEDHITNDDELQQMAREALGANTVDLKARVQEILAREEGRTVPPMGEIIDQNIDAEVEKYYSENNISPVNSNLEDSQSLPPEVDQRKMNFNDINQIVKVKSSDAAMFAVQVGSYPEVKEASYRVEEWKARGYPAYMMIADLGEKGLWYRVRIGSFNDKEGASIYLTDLKDREGIKDAFVIRNEQ